QYLRYVGFCWPVPCPALWRELMHCTASPSARDFAERDLWNVGRGSALLHLDVGRPDHLAPLLGFVGDKLAEVRRRACEYRATKFGKPRLSSWHSRYT